VAVIRELIEAEIRNKHYRISELGPQALKSNLDNPVLTRRLGAECISHDWYPKQCERRHTGGDEILNGRHQRIKGVLELTRHRSNLNGIANAFRNE